MLSYSKSDIAVIYDDLIRNAFLEFKKGRMRCALKDISTAARWAYNFNHIYTDPEAETLLKQISEATIERVTIRQSVPNHYVLIDSFLWDNRGLTQQYLRAMMSCGAHILIIHTQPDGSIGRDIQAEIAAYAKGEIRQYPKGLNQIEFARQIVKDIETFQPERIFLHLAPWELSALMACNAVKGALKYQINLTDHAYWLGASFVDYVFEFRPYGLTVSLDKRFLRQDQLLPLPFYPITPYSPHFDGLPVLPPNAIVVFTGGAPYKMLGKNNIFFHMMERVLSISPNVYILVAGFAPDPRFDEQVSKLKGCERILQIGVRRDINAVFEHCDVYLGTYPMMGGLMTQYAALHGKPVVAYHDEGDVMNATEEMVNFYQHDYHSFTNLDEMTDYARRLVEDATYRQEQGQLLLDGMMNGDKFNHEFAQIIQSNHSPFVWNKDAIDYEAFFERYLELENSDGFSATRVLLRTQNIGAFLKLKHVKCKLLAILICTMCTKCLRVTFGSKAKRIV